MHKRQLLLRNEHMFVVLEKRLFMFDTGSPQSFSSSPTITIDGRRFSLPSSYVGVTPEYVSEMIGMQTSGLLGVDILNEFDIIADVPRETIEFSSQQLDCNGTAVQLEMLLGIPIVPVRIGEAALSMLLDTGAQISYIEGEFLANCEPAGPVEDFHPMVGRFNTTTY